MTCIIDHRVAQHLIKIRYILQSKLLYIYTGFIIGDRVVLVFGSYRRRSLCRSPSARCSAWAASSNMRLELLALLLAIYASGYVTGIDVEVDAQASCSSDSLVNFNLLTDVDYRVGNTTLPFGEIKPSWFGGSLASGLSWLQTTLLDSVPRCLADYRALLKDDGLRADRIHEAYYVRIYYLLRQRFLNST